MKSERKRILMVGTGPLLDEPEARLVSGQCLRTVHFLRPLVDAGHDVKLFTVPIPGTTEPDAGVQARERTWRNKIPYMAFATHDEAVVVQRLKFALKGHFDAIVGVNAYPTYLLAKSEPTPPFWADLNGWTMAEGQTRAAVVESNKDLDHFWRLEATALLAADRFSTASERQGDALYGELAMAGRLVRETFDWPFAEPVPNAVAPEFAELRRSGAFTIPDQLRGAVPEEAHLVLWSGGFNTWTDVEMLTRALEIAMKLSSRIHFVATGGAVAGHDEETYTRFQALVRERLPADRVHLLGWVETSLVKALHARANVGLNVDSRNTETRFGARNRLTNMLGAGVPVATTRGTEIAAWIERQDFGAVVPTGDARALGEALADSAERPGAWLERAERARQRALEDFNPAATLKAFLAWCADPAHAPDHLLQRSLAESGPHQWTRWKVEGEVERLLTDRAALEKLRGRFPLNLFLRSHRRSRKG